MENQNLKTIVSIIEAFKPSNFAYGEISPIEAAENRVKVSLLTGKFDYDGIRGHLNAFADMIIVAAELDGYELPFDMKSLAEDARYSAGDKAETAFLYYNLATQILRVIDSIKGAE